jgi:hypothetical protein
MVRKGISAIALAIAVVLTMFLSSIALADTGAVSPNWQLFESSYESDELVVAGATVQEFGAVADGVTDNTAAFQAALNFMSQAGGGAVYVPKGKYVLRGNLTIPKGTTLIGEIKPAVKGQPVEGTVLMAYAGRGNVDAKAFITMQPVTAVRDLAIWYPEQTPDNITAYPPSIMMGDPSIWGDNYSTVENVQFVNSYIGFKKALTMGGCPTLRNITGSPLKAGIIIDALADVGRIEHVDFSPEYWEASGLPGSPSAAGAHRAFMYEKGIAIEMHRNDWSYGRFLSAEGYNVGFHTLNSFNVEAYNGESHTRIKDQFPNGENYGLSFKNCYIGVAIENTSNAGVVFTNVKITDSENGIVLRNTFDSKINLMDWKIDVSGYAVLHEGSGILMAHGLDVERGKVEISSGYASILDSDFNNAAPQVTYGAQSAGSLLGNRFQAAANITNNSTKGVTIDHTPVAMEKVPTFPEVGIMEKKPAKAVLYNVKAAPYLAKADNVTDDSAAIQAALNDAGQNGGGVVFLPSGQYAVKANLIVPEGVELRGALDTPQSPMKYGATIEVYPGKNQENGTPFIQVSKNAIVRGLSFDYPEQDYKTVIPYPYTIRGMGDNVSLINIGVRNAYNFIDLFTYKNDHAYVEYMGGQIWRTGIRVGGGTEHAMIMDTQLNYGNLVDGSESKWGSWTNSPPKGSTPAEQAAFEVDRSNIEGYMKNNFETFVLGDTKDILFYNNFTFPAGVGLTLKSENGTGPSGSSLGYASDNSRIAFLVEDIGQEGFNFINTQLVGITSHNLIPIGVKTSPGFTKKITLFGVALWGSLDRFTELNGSGTVEIQGANFASSIDRDFVVNQGKLKVINSKINTFKSRLIDMAPGTEVSFIATNYLRGSQAQPIPQTDFQQWIANSDQTGVKYQASTPSAVTQVVVDESVWVKLAGSTVKFTGQAPYMEGNIVYVPIQVILEKLGYPVTWEAATNTLVVDTFDKKLRMPVNSVTATVDGQVITLDAPIRKPNGDVVVPSTFIGAALGSEVAFDLAKRELNISLPHMEDTPRDSQGEISQLRVFVATASASQVGNEVSHLIDGKADTRWAAEGNHYAILDLGAKRIITSVKISFYAGQSRIYPFTIQVSEDGKTWTQVISTQNSGKTQAYEEYLVSGNAYGRYVKYNGTGSNLNKWNSMWGMEVYGIQVSPITLIVPANMTVEATGERTAVDIGTATSSGGATVTNDAPKDFPLGTTVVTWTASKANGVTKTAKQTITVVDTKPPVITGEATTQPNANGWYNDDVTIHFTATDSGSGLASVTPDVVLSTEGANQSVTGTAVDKAGNTATAAVYGIRIDKTKPVVVINAAASYKTTDSLTVTYAVYDSLSGVGNVTATLNGQPVINGQVVSLAGMAGSNILVVTAADLAGNSTDQSITFEVSIAAVVDLNPSTLNNKSSGGANSMTAYIELPPGYDPSLINAASIKLNVNGVFVDAQLAPTELGDYNGNNVKDLMVKFDRQKVIAALGSLSGDIKLTLSGSLNDGKKLEATTAIKVTE